MRVRIWWIAAPVIVLTVAATVWAAKRPSPSLDDEPRIVRLGSMSIDRAAHQATALASGEVLITGGCSGGGCSQVLASTEIYEPATDSFRPGPSMTIRRISHTAIRLNDGRVLIIGGWSDRRPTSSAEIYDPESGRFVSAGEMTEVRMGPAVALLPDGRVLIAGGETATMTPVATAEVFDPATDTFSPLPPMQTARGAHVALSLSDGRVLLAGGHRGRGNVLASAEMFDPNSGSFHPVGDMSVPRHKHAAALLSDGTALIVGGSDDRDHDGRYRSTEIFDPSSNTFSPGPEMHHARFKLHDAVVALPSGAVLAAGGGVSAEIFDPSARRFELVNGHLDAAQSFATATPLPSGDVLILGGYDDRIRPSSAAWRVVTAPGPDRTEPRP